MPLAIIFDIDGTLVDSVDAHAESWARTFSHFGHPVSVADARFQIGKGGDLLVPYLVGDEAAQAQGADMAIWRADLFKREYLPHIRPFPQVPDLFRHIRAQGQRIALASSAKGDELQVYKEIAGITDLVDEETSADDAEKSKPHPDIFAAALQRLGLPPQQAVVVGDTHYDAEAAAKAGMGAVGMLCGGFPEDVLRRAGCIAIYRDPAALLAGYAASPLAH
jgi:phosphoglycolate phosphatase-like HAD superfamily hydrolase